MSDFKSKKSEILYYFTVTIALLFFFFFGFIAGYFNASHDCIHNNNFIISSITD